MILVGVDAGATATRALAVGADGHVHGRGSAGPANPHNVGAAASAEQIAGAVRMATAGSRPEILVAGVAGLGDPSLTRELHSALLATGIASTVHLYSDAAAALDGAFLGRPGIIVIAGTGSVAWGRNARGEEARAGGWGHIIDDAGSGYDLGRRGLTAVLRAHDGRGSTTALTPRLLAALQVERADDLAGPVRRMAPSEIAALAPAVLDAARDGDSVARDIVRDAAAALTGLATAVWRRLDLPRRSPVAPIGGVLADALMRAEFAAALARECPGAVLADPRLPPVAGAVWRAHIVAGTTPDERLVAALDEDRASRTRGTGAT